MAELLVLSGWSVSFLPLQSFTPFVRFRVTCASHLALAAVIALGAESLEVTQQLDDTSSADSSSANFDFVVVDAAMSFVSQHDYAAAAVLLNALLNVRARRCMSSALLTHISVSSATNRNRICTAEAHDSAVVVPLCFQDKPTSDAVIAHILPHFHKL